ncbi:MAG: lysophospholipid acyltransferase family protein [Deltaproteobacteria bacterium]|jgi:predicted LPLAT superfamily acyltransferase|nr:lysophospholipid acyltransferase family protein [Deltaproteobacteria bacterium]
MRRSRRNLGAHWQYLIFRWIVRCRALPLARALMAIVVVYYTLLPHVRRRCSHYLRRRFGEAGGWRGFVRACRLHLNFGQVLLDKMVVEITGRFPVFSPLPAVWAELVEAAKNPDGCIVLTAHTGAWQVGLAGLEELKRPVHIAQPHDPDDPDTLSFERGTGATRHIINVAEPIVALVEIAAVLRRGNFVCMMGDRLARDTEKSVTVPFLGGNIALPVGAYALASVTRAEIVMLFSVHEKGRIRVVGAERFKVPPRLPRNDPSVFLPFATRFVRLMEEFVQSYPYQFFNFYNMWVDEA